MRHGKRKRLSLAPVILDASGPCDCCFVNLEAGEVVIGFDDGEPGQAKTFCVRCVSGALIEANGTARAQRRARPIHVFIREQGSNDLIHTVELKGGLAVVRRAIAGLSQKVDFDRYWVDLSELEAREQQAQAPPGG